MQHLQVEIPTGDIVLDGTLTMPESPAGLVVIAQGSNRRSARDAHLAGAFAKRGLAVLVVNLVTAGEVHCTIDVLTNRLSRALDWVGATRIHKGRPIALFAAGRDATAAMIAAVHATHPVAGVACAGGCFDLAGDWLTTLRTPTLCIVGSRDTAGLRSAHRAARMLVAQNQTAVISGSSHLFDDPGALAEVAAIAGTWFVEQFSRRRARAEIAAV